MFVMGSLCAFRVGFVSLGVVFVVVFGLVLLCCSDWCGVSVCDVLWCVLCFGVLCVLFCSVWFVVVCLSGVDLVFMLRCVCYGCFVCVLLCDYYVPFCHVMWCIEFSS